ncbi:hypothetical protein ACWDXU_28895, partial [Nocardia sp. NPDC003167]
QLVPPPVLSPALVAGVPPVGPAGGPPPRPLPEVLAGVGQTALDTSRRAMRAGLRRWHSATPKIRSALAGGLAALLLVVGGLAYWATRPASEPAPVTGLTLAQLRQTDACAWLGKAIGDAVPVAPAPLAADTWKLDTSTTWGCYATSNRTSLSLELGTEDMYLTPNQTIVDGVPIIDGSAAGCTRAIASPGAEGPSGIVITLHQPSGVKGCEGIDYVAANIARSLSSAPRAAHQESSLALVEPCTLLDRELVAARIGALAPAPTVADAHTCQLNGSVQLSLKLVSSSRYTSGNEQVTVSVDGYRLYVDQATSTKAMCTRAYLAPRSEKETVEVTVHGAEGMREDYCAIAAEVLRSAAEKLPNR